MVELLFFLFKRDINFILYCFESFKSQLKTNYLVPFHGEFFSLIIEKQLKEV